ncbi:hypothetical protein ACFSC3_03100 [Sphingomonas floccifaciens]|uniref:Uncharacterized protein n=1 Tax=Sphingomonas floccifaciens TaxID=1844115 RepID=A0ABW4N9I5_9SPHN
MPSRIESLIPTPPPERIDALQELIVRIVDCLDADEDCDALIAEADALAGSQGYDRVTFCDLHSWTSERDFAALAAMGPPPAIPDLTVQEVAECIGVIEAADEPRSSFCLGILERTFPNIPVCDMIYCARAAASSDDLAADIVRLGKEPLPTLPAP